MTATDSSHDQNGHPDAKAHPFGLLVGYLREIGGTDERAHKRGFKNRIKEEGFEDFLDQLITEWLQIKYTNALSAAFPPSTVQLKQRHEQKKKVVSEKTTSVEMFKAKIMDRALDLPMPNGKPLRECTGAECVAFGGWLTKVGERVGLKARVGDVLTNKQITEIARKIS